MNLRAVDRLNISDKLCIFLGMLGVRRLAYRQRDGFLFDRPRSFGCKLFSSGQCLSLRIIFQQGLSAKGSIADTNCRFSQT